MTPKKLYALGGAAVFVLVATFLVGSDEAIKLFQAFMNAIGSLL